jgi:hypothetical protein
MGRMKRIINSVIILLYVTSCQYYRDFWTPPKKIDLSDRKMYKSKPCGRIHQYDTRYPLCPNQKCRDQWNAVLINHGKNYGGEHWNFYLKECRLKKGEPKTTI